MPAKIGGALIVGSQEKGCYRGTGPFKTQRALDLGGRGVSSRTPCSRVLGRRTHVQQRTLTGRSAICDSRSTHNPTNQGTKTVRQPAFKDCVLRSWVAARRAAQARVHRKLQRAKSGRAKAYGGCCRSSGYFGDGTGLEHEPPKREHTQAGARCTLHLPNRG